MFRTPEFLQRLEDMIGRNQMLNGGVSGSSFKRNSKFRYLVQQVEQQSPLCDFTVKVREWRKRFHRCVLVTCPYFDKAMRGNFTEKQRGIVEVSVGTPCSVEMAIMYLYGVVPDIKIENIGQLLEQAEYFMMAGLKSTCIHWLRSFEVTENAYMYILKLSSVYHFELPNCKAYIESHLPEVFRTLDALDFSKEFVMELFTNERLSYVSSDERLSFLKNWVQRNANERKACILELLETIDLDDVTDSIWQQALSVRLLDEVLVSNNLVRTPNRRECKTDVLIMSGMKGLLLCFNFQNKTWYKLIPENSNEILYRHISGIKNTKAEVYFTKGECDLMPKFTTLDIDNKEIKTYNFTLRNEDISRETITNICIADSTLVVLTRKRVQMIETNTLENGRHNADCSCTSSATICSGTYPKRVRIPVICDNEILYPSQFRSEGRNVNVKDMINTAVHIGNVSVGDIEIEPIFYLRNMDISKVCLNSTISTMALLPKDNNSVILFDLVNYKLETFYLDYDTRYKVSATNKGFVVYNNKRCYCLTNMYWSLPSQKYLIELFELESTSNDQRIDYLFSNGFWFRVYNKMYIDLEISFTRHEQLLTSRCPKDLKWTKISIPDRNIMHNFLPDNGLFVVQLSKKNLRCHIDCPHCKYTK